MDAPRLRDDATAFAQLVVRELRSLRQARGWSCNELAEHTDGAVSRSSISNYESNPHRHLPLPVLWELSHALRTPVSEVLAAAETAFYVSRDPSLTPAPPGRVSDVPNRFPAVLHRPRPISATAAITAADISVRLHDAHQTDQGVYFTCTVHCTRPTITAIAVAGGTLYPRDPAATVLTITVHTADRPQHRLPPHIRRTWHNHPRSSTITNRTQLWINQPDPNTAGSSELVITAQIADLPTLTLTLPTTRPDRAAGAGTNESSTATGLDGSDDLAHTSAAVAMTGDEFATRVVTVLRRMRVDARLTQTDLANATNSAISRPALTSYETGTARLRLDHLWHLAQALSSTIPAVTDTAQDPTLNDTETPLPRRVTPLQRRARIRGEPTGGEPPPRSGKIPTETSPRPLVVRHEKSPSHYYGTNDAPTDVQ